jgi:hypothetical protein
VLMKTRFFVEYYALSTGKDLLTVRWIVLLSSTLPSFGMLDSEDEDITIVRDVSKKSHTGRHSVTCRKSVKSPDSWPLTMWPIRCPETSVKDYDSTLRNTPEERRS